jgi:hypothetical protein
MPTTTFAVPANVEQVGVRLYSGAASCLSAGVYVGQRVDDRGQRPRHEQHEYRALLRRGNDRHLDVPLRLYRGRLQLDVDPHAARRSRTRRADLDCWPDRLELPDPDPAGGWVATRAEYDPARVGGSAITGRPWNVMPLVCGHAGRRLGGACIHERGSGGP